MWKSYAARAAWGLAGLAFALLAVAQLSRQGIAAREPRAVTGSDPMKVPGRLLQVQGRVVHVLTRGKEGPQLVLVHGLPGSTVDWEDGPLARLSKRFRVVAIDLWGFGFSERREHFPYDAPLWVGQLEGVMDALAIEDATLVGTSFGSGIAALYAARHPERLRRLVLISAPGPGTFPLPIPLARLLAVPLLGEALIAQLDHVARDPEWSAIHHERDRKASQIAGTRDAILRMLRHPPRLADLSGAYRRIRTRTLVLHGTRDPIVAPRVAQLAVGRIAGARLAWLRHGGHFLVRDQPNPIADHIERFAAPRAPRRQKRTPKAAAAATGAAGDM